MGFTGFLDKAKSQTSILCCVMHSSLVISLLSLIFVRLDFLTKCSQFVSDYLQMNMQQVC